MRFLFLSLLLFVSNMMHAFKVGKQEKYAWLSCWKSMAESRLSKSYPSWSKNKIVTEEWGWRPLLLLHIYNMNGKIINSFEYDRFTDTLKKF